MISLNETDVQLYCDALDKWGEDIQAGMLMEECGECIAALHHYKRSRIDVVELLSEMADVINAMGQLILILADDHNCSPDEVLKDLAKQLELSKTKLREAIGAKP